jgi:hypothetical protein
MGAAVQTAPSPSTHNGTSGWVEQAGPAVSVRSLANSLRRTGRRPAGRSGLHVTCSALVSIRWLPASFLLSTAAAAINICSALLNGKRMERRARAAAKEPGRRRRQVKGRSTRSFGSGGSDPSSLCCVMGCIRGPFDSLFRIGSTNLWINPLHAHLDCLVIV